MDKDKGSITIRSMQRLQDRCPEHRALPLWYAETEGPRRLEVARYDCGCLCSVDPDIMGEAVIREVITDA